MNEPWLTLIGIAGIALLLLAFILNHRKRVVRFTYTYNVLNFVGAALLAFYAFEIKAMVFVYLQIIWVAVASYFIIKKAVSKK